VILTRNLILLSHHDEDDWSWKVLCSGEKVGLSFEMPRVKKLDGVLLVANVPSQAVFQVSREIS
jgi:hypothetical protein